MPAKKVTEVKMGNGESIVLWKATRALTQEEHEQLSLKIRFEQEQSGVKIALVPYSVDVEVVNQIPSETGNDPDQSGEGL